MRKWGFQFKIPPLSFKGKAEQNMFLINRTFNLTLNQRTCINTGDNHDYNNVTFIHIYSTLGFPI